jgi:hypothetical protein
MKLSKSENGRNAAAVAHRRPARQPRVGRDSSYDGAAGRGGGGGACGVGSDKLGALALATGADMATAIGSRNDGACGDTTTCVVVWHAFIVGVLE